METQKSEPDFLRKTRHDIHGAMYVVIGMSDVLAMSDTLSPSLKEIVSMQRKNADRALELIDSIFIFLQSAESQIQGSVPIKAALPAETEQKED